MLRGAVESRGPDHISGWVFSEEVELSGRLMLAFNETDCIGAARVDIHRPDLESAGLSHGRYGFYIPVPAEHSERAVHVKLEGSDAMLIAPNSQIIVEGGLSQAARSLDRDDMRDMVDRYKWLGKRGLITPDRLDLFKQMLRDGHYKVTAKEGQSLIQQAQAVLCDYFLEPVTCTVVDVADDTELKNVMAQTADPIAISSQTAASVELVEGSHITGAENGQTIPVALSNERILWLHSATECTMADTSGPLSVVIRERATDQAGAPQ